MKSPTTRASRDAESASGVLGFIRSIGTVELVIAAMTLVISIASWLAFIVITEPDFQNFTIVYAVTVATGTVIQIIMLTFVRASGSLRARLGVAGIFANPSSGENWGVEWKDGRWARTGVAIITPIIISAIVFLLVTPPATSAESFDPDMSLYQVIGLLTMLGMVFASLGVVVFVIFVIPLGMLVAARLPIDRDAEGRPFAAATVNSQLTIAALIILCVSGFAVSIFSVLVDPPSPNRSGQMWEQFVAFITFTGDPIATALCWFFLVALIALVIADRRLNNSKRLRRGKD